MSNPRLGARAVVVNRTQLLSTQSLLSAGEERVSKR